jgi:hypothetical protein
MLNLVNIVNSHFSLSGWLGILFINVFGTWNGSFGVDTAAGNPIPTPNPTTGSNNNGGQNNQTYTVVAVYTNNQPKKTYQSGQTTSEPEENQNTTLAVLNGPSTPIIQSAASSSGFAWKAALASLCCFMALGGIQKRRNGRKTQPVQIEESEVISPAFLSR